MSSAVLSQTTDRQSPKYYQNIVITLRRKVLTSLKVFSKYIYNLVKVVKPSYSKQRRTSLTSEDYFHRSHEMRTYNALTI